MRHCSLLILLLLGCAENTPSQQLHIDLITDFVPAVEFDGIRIQLGEGELAVISDHLVDLTANYIRGTRLASLSVPRGDSRLRVTLFRSTDAIVHRDVVVTVAAHNQTVTIVVSRNCRGVMCPASGNPSFDTCLGGRCVDPRCTPETQEFCPAPECTMDGMCTVADCADGVCADGVCLASPRPERCATQEYCDGTLGCILVMPQGDAGVLDAGVLDSTMPDAPLPDSSPDTPADTQFDSNEDVFGSRCDDGIQNGTETDIDCGGGICSPCSTGLMCVLPGDCVGDCMTGRCVNAPSCVDGIQNGSETDVDCGGIECSSCALDSSCEVSTDCTSMLCRDGSCAEILLCENGIQNAGEADVDCGGTCPPCDDGRSCTEDTHCISAHCVFGMCALQTCYDGLRNGDETALDCGGSCLKCIGEICLAGAECASGACAINFECE